LTWKAQLKNVMNKAYRAFWTRNGISGKTWGPKPRVVYWIYTMVIRPVLTYGFMVWWPTVRYNVSRTELSKIQRLACLVITGAMKTTPTAAMEVLLDLPPLHVMIEVEAQAGIYRLMCNQQWKPKSTNFGHTKKSRDMEHEPILQMGSDRMLPRYAYHKPFTVKFPDKCEWQMGCTQTTKGVWSGTQKGPRPITALVLVFIDGAQEGGTASVLGSTPWYSRLKYMPLRHV
jgi:hypothetical protein